MQSVFITNADTPLGCAIACEMLLGDKRHQFDRVCGSVHKISESGSLLLRGASLCELTLGASEREVVEELRHVDTLILVPDHSAPHDRMIRQVETFLRAAKHARVQRCLLLSILGAEEKAEVPVGKAFYRMEELVMKEGGLKHACVVRQGFLLNWLLPMSPQVRHEQTLSMPVHARAKFAPLNLSDLTIFVTFLVAQQHQEGAMAMASEVKLTGGELVTGPQLVDQLNRTLQLHVRWHEWNRAEAEQHLRHLLHNEHWVQNAMGVFDLINRDKYNHLSRDEKNKTGKEPLSLQKFFQDNHVRFEKQQE